MEGNFMEWDYSILSEAGHKIADVSKQLWNLTNTSIDVYRSETNFCCLMLVLAIDAEKHSKWLESSFATTLGTYDIPNCLLSAIETEGNVYVY